MLVSYFELVRQKVREWILAVPVSWKIVGIGLLPVIILGISLNYWITISLSDWLSYILTDVRVEAAMNAGSRSMMFVTVLGAVLSIFVSLFLTVLLSSPLQDLQETAQEVASGKFEKRAKVWARDEIGSLATSINQMIDNFVNIQEDLSNTNKRLETINRIAMAAENEEDIHDVLYTVLQTILNAVGLNFGWVYLCDPEMRKIHLASWSNVPDPLKACLLLKDGDAPCACQKKLLQGEYEDQVVTIQCNRLKCANYPNGKNRHLSIPIISDGTPFGIINLNCPTDQPIDEETLGLLRILGSQVSRMVANAWLQLKLREKEAARHLLLESLVTAQEDERQRLARELHDQAGQTLTNILIRIKTVEHKSQDEKIKHDLSVLMDTVSDAIEQIRELSYDLRPPALEHFGLGTALQSLAADMAHQNNLTVEFDGEMEGNIPSECAVTLYRIFQEAMTNIVRHAGAKHISIELAQRQQIAYMRVEDDGCGFDPDQITMYDGKRHLGLISMNERAELFGGRLKMQSAVGEGTCLEVFLPIPSSG